MTETTDQRIVWGIGTSRTLRVHWALAELNLPYRTVPLRTRTPEMEQAEFLAINPRKKIPVLQDGELTLTESGAIVNYLAEKYGSPQASLIPTDVIERAKYFEWASMITMELDATTLYVLRRHQDLPETYGEAPEAIQSAQDYFDRMLGAAIPDILSGGPYLLGNNFSGADILLGSCFQMADHFGLNLPAELSPYRARLDTRPAFNQARKVNTP